MRKNRKFGLCIYGKLATPPMENSMRKPWKDVFGYFASPHFHGLHTALSTVAVFKAIFPQLHKVLLL